MRNTLLTALALSLLAPIFGCASGEHEVVVTREQFGKNWPLEVNSAVVVCSTDASGTVLKLGQRLYALDEAARSGGHPDARGVVAMRGSGDTTPLLSVCTAVAAAD